MKARKRIERLPSDPLRSQAALHIVCDMLEAGEFSKVEVIVAMLTAIALQYSKQRPIPPQELDDFLVKATDWIARYWEE